MIDMPEGATEMHAISQQYAGLNAEKRKLFRGRLVEHGMSISRLPIVRLNDRPSCFPLSAAQERLWFLWKLEPESAAYNIPGALRLEGKLDVGAVRSALSGLVSRHEALGTRFGEADGVAFQMVEAEGAYGWEECEVTEGEVAASVRSLVSRPFDLERGPLLRAAALRLGPEEHVLVLAMHHIVSDGWSISILVKEFVALYGAAASLAELPI